MLSKFMRKSLEWERKPAKYNVSRAGSRLVPRTSHSWVTKGHPSGSAAAPLSSCQNCGFDKQMVSEVVVVVVFGRKEAIWSRGLTTCLILLLSQWQT